MTHFTPYTPYVIPSPPQTPSYVKDHLDVLSMDMDPLNLWEKDLPRHDVADLADDMPRVMSFDPGSQPSSAPLCGSPCSVCTECCCDVCSRDASGVARDSAGVAGTPSTCIHSWEDVDVEPLNLAIANTCGKAQVAFALPSGCDDNASLYDYEGSDDEDSLMDSVMLDSSHETYTPSNFLGMSRDAEKMGSDQVQSMHSCEATFVSPVRSAQKNLEKISMGLFKLAI